MIEPIIKTCDLALAAALNGIWQGSIIAIVVAIILCVVRRTNAATRHAIWFCTLILLVALLLAHCLIATLPHPRRDAKANHGSNSPNRDLDTNLAGEIVTRFKDQDSEGDVSTAFGSGDVLTIPGEQREQGASPTRDVRDRSNASPVEPLSLYSSIAGRSESNDPVGAGSGTLETNRSSNPSHWGWMIGRLARPVSANLALGDGVPRSASAIVLALGLLAAGIRICFFFGKVLSIRSLKRHSAPPSSELESLFRSLVARLQVNRNVSLRISAAHRSSYLLGFLDPVILLPSEQEIEPGEVEFVLRHELAHVRRRDDWANLIQHFILAAFPFHPALGWISRRISLEREIACDDQVLHQSAQPRAYALLLANLAARMQAQPRLLAPGALNNRTQLHERIDMILNTNRNSSPRLAKTPVAFITTATTLLAVAIVGSAPRIVLGSASPPPAALSAETPIGGFPGSAPAAEPASAVSLAISAPVGVTVGPKDKPDRTFPHPVHPIAPSASRTFPTPAVPTGPAAVAMAPAPGAPTLWAAGTPPEPRPGRVPRVARERADGSVEERLERLEQLVHSLMSLQQPKPEYRNELKPGAPAATGPWERSMKMELFAPKGPAAGMNTPLDPKEAGKIKEQAKQLAVRAEEQAKRATAEAGTLKTEQKRQLKQGSQMQLEGLRRQREALEREREKLDRQIEELRRHQELLDEQFEEESANDLQAEASVSADEEAGALRRR